MSKRTVPKASQVVACVAKGVERPRDVAAMVGCSVGGACTVMTRMANAQTPRIIRTKRGHYALAPERHASLPLPRPKPAGRSWVAHLLVLLCEQEAGVASSERLRYLSGEDSVIIANSMLGASKRVIEGYGASRVKKMARGVWAITDEGRAWVADVLHQEAELRRWHRADDQAPPPAPVLSIVPPPTPAKHAPSATTRAPTLSRLHAIMMEAAALSHELEHPPGLTGPERVILDHARRSIAWAAEGLEEITEGVDEEEDAA